MTTAAENRGRWDSPGTILLIAADYNAAPADVRAGRRPMVSDAFSILAVGK